MSKHENPHTANSGNGNNPPPKPGSLDMRIITEGTTSASGDKSNQQQDK